MKMSAKTKTVTPDQFVEGRFAKMKLQFTGPNRNKNLGIVGAGIAIMIMGQVSALW